MGCFSLKFLVACIVGSSKIKIMTVDGQCLQYDAPMYVKEVLVDYPDHAIFHSQTVIRKLRRNSARPLQGTLQLQPGKLYLLSPFDHKEAEYTSQTPSRRRPSSETVPALEQGRAVDQPLQQQAQQQEHNLITRKVSFASTPSYMECSAHSAHVNETASEDLNRLNSVPKPLLEMLPSAAADGSVVRLKIVVSKRQLAKNLQEVGDTVSMVEGLLMPVLREIQAARSNLRSDTYAAEMSSNCSWKPALENIPESSS